jgi:hypothetical protein
MRGSPTGDVSRLWRTPHEGPLILTLCEEHMTHKPIGESAFISLHDACFTALYQIAQSKEGEEKETFLKILMEAYNVKGNG